MSLSRMLSVAAVAATLLASAPAHAADAAFSERLTQARVSAAAAAFIDREERILIDSYLEMARSLRAQSSEAKAKRFLDYACGRLGLHAGTTHNGIVRPAAGQMSVR